MNILDLLNDSVGGDGLAKLGGSFGLDPAQSRALAEQLAPAIAGGARRRAQQEGGVHALLAGLEGESQARYLSQPEAAAEPDARAQGEAFLETIFGQREGQAQLADAAADRTGAPREAAESFLPALAALLQGAMQQRAPDAEIQAARQAFPMEKDRPNSGLGEMFAEASRMGGGTEGPGLGGLLGGLLGALGGAAGAQPGTQAGTQPAAGGGSLGSLLMMLDRDGDGSPLDDVVGMLMRR